MTESTEPKPTIIYIFGGSGDLTQRKLIPALYNLYLDQLLPERLQIVGVGRSSFTNQKYRNRLKEGIQQFSRRKEEVKTHWNAFSKTIDYCQLDASSEKAIRQICSRIKKTKDKWKVEPDVIYYLSVTPQLAPVIARNLYKNKLATDPKRHRLIFEKPFGHDLNSARELNVMLQKMFREEQIYRIDHFLGKETVQNILALRFANALFEPLWNRNYIDHIQISATETVSVEDRGSYFEESGALRDMVQNHMLQMLCMIAMEAPVSFQPDEIRNKKVDVLRAVHQFEPDEVHRRAVRGQYNAGWVHGEKINAYRSEKGVNENSSVETYAAVKLFIDNWRWSGVPFYLRTGKALTEKSTHISIEFKSAPYYAFPDEAAETWRPNRLVINISPKFDIRLRFQAKKKGPRMTLQPVDMVFNYFNDNAETHPEAYETLLLDVIQGEATLFMRADQVEAAWEVITPIMQVWKNKPPVDFPNYAAGTWGPEDAEALIARDGRYWVSQPGE
jgi:glucose-6-phosphate 1-dehydrogenase